MVAASPLLETKLYAPTWRTGFVSRPRLIERLGHSSARKLTLLSAPPGFGKTTLLAEWLATFAPEDRRAAWLSLDQNDNHPATFWTYFATAIQRVHAGVGARALAHLQAPQPPPVEALLPELLNEVAALADDFFLVLDDYHIIDSPAIHQGITFLLDHLPQSMHLIITARSDPPLPLALLRGRGELVEVRAADLRFTPDETAAFLQEAMDHRLSAHDVSVLEARTEGWAAGLQLAALSMHGRADVSRFIEDFGGNDRYVVDYLVEEVLKRQPDAVRRFLLETSILARLSGPLCDAVTGDEGGRATLERLERGNLFVVPLDDKRQWYRYHHLFADVLQAHLVEEQPETLSGLHRRASEWFEQNAQPHDAIRHALAASDFEQAAGLVELAMPALLRSRQEVTLLGWLKALPQDLVRLRPVLSAGYAGVLLQSAELRAVEGRLRDAEQALASASHTSARRGGPSDGPVYVDEEQFRGLPGMIALYRAGCAQVAGNLPDTVKYARLALEVMPEEHPLRGGAMALLGLALWTGGDLEAAHQTYADGIARVHRAGYVNDSSTIMMADMRIAQGRLREALSTYERSLQLAGQQGRTPPRGTADVYVGISELYREFDDLDAATQQLLKSEALGEIAALPENRYRWFTAMAGIKKARGDLDGALDLLDEAERHYVGSFSPDVRPIPALRAQLWLAQGRLADALGWVRQQQLSPDEELSYVREFQHLILVRVLIAQHEQQRDGRTIHEAGRLLERLLEAAEAGGRTGAIIEILVLQAIARRALGDIPAAIADLGRALALAEPEGYVRLFLDEGEPVRDLLQHAPSAGGTGSYARRLLSTFEAPAATVSAPLQMAAPGLIDQLTAREVEILRLIGSGMRNQEIAEHLVISPSTVKRHIANAYSKLSVSHRTEALLRARELNLL